MGEKAKGTKKGRKIGRNAAWCKRYALSHRREHNKIRRLKKRLTKFPNDKSAIAAMDLCRSLIRGTAVEKQAA